ncbi:MAG: hypothetical protein EOQ42_19185 [Mesorhizobium sp.]|uniref:hypothetical protein n=1 Tax=Mesorhizobium sp. TaxID=1871066 RepID=UPI000FE93891|nr:hypothetical protein [Mesorhizobium sp.]RWB30219.1 MAG: hypothetical protein EOQ43_17150 [Mesorhizobium sp.]RWB62840.1 MAG: hypothetical protein EOQ42_19185 [Mesorhizobium sp.]RWD20244.1 MAG: hypothetical protein EOS57_09900 [Mesorhizobium sp.]TIU79421.1 MAG: hypothetical protein E5W13_07335 [Mesorhizobium sp.]
MAFHTFNGRFVAGLALTGFMLTAAGCQSGGNGILGFGKTDTTPPPPPDPKVLASQLQAYCPKVTLRDGTAFFNTYAKGGQKPKKKAAAQDEAAALDASSDQQDDSAKIIHQASITDVTRDCNRANGSLTMKIAVAGRVVPGPMFSQGTITMPIRIAVMHGTEVLYSQLHRYQVQVTNPSSATQFVFTDSNVVIPEPTARDYQAFAGYDEGPPKKTDKKIAAAE